MDRDIDLTMSALFCRKERPEEMLSDEYLVWQQDTRLPDRWNPRDLTLLGLSEAMVIDFDAEKAAKDEEENWKAFFRIFNVIHPEVENSLYFTESACDCCGETLNVLSEARDYYGVCRTCASRQEEQQPDYSKHIKSPAAYRFFTLAGKIRYWGHRVRCLVQKDHKLPDKIYQNWSKKALLEAWPYE